MKNLKLGQVLFAGNGEKVTLKAIRENSIIVEYRYKMYKRPLNIIGEKLFVEPLKIYTCYDCFLQRGGTCFGKDVICNDFKYAPRMTESDHAYWPKYVDYFNW